MTREELLALLSIKGMAKTEHLAEAFDVDAAEAESVLAELEAEGAVEQTRIGVKLTGAGKDEAERLRESEIAAASAENVAALYERFEPINTAFKTRVSEWQMRPGQEGQVPNDHSDAQYDAAILEGVIEDHPAILRLLEDAAAEAPRLALYGGRLDRALAHIREGEHRYLTAPLIDSYHTIWFEMHEDLIRLAGRTRADEAAAGRAG